MAHCPTCYHDLKEGPLKVSLDTNVATRNGLWVQLTPTQAEILHVLVDKGFVSTDQLFSSVYGGARFHDEDIPQHTTLRGHMFKLREALKPLAVTVKGTQDRFNPGYSLEFLDEGH